MTYAAPIVTMASRPKLAKLQTKENKILRLLLNKPYDYSRQALYSEAGVVPILGVLSCQREKFISKCPNSLNPLIRNLYR